MLTPKLDWKKLDKYTESVDYKNYNVKTFKWFLVKRSKKFHAGWRFSIKDENRNILARGNILQKEWFRNDEENGEYDGDGKWYKAEDWIKIQAERELKKLLKK